MTENPPMADPAVKLTKSQRTALLKLVGAGGEAIRAGTTGYRANGFMIAEERPVLGLAKRGAVDLQTVGESTFAVVSDEGRALLDALKDEGEGRG